MNSGVDSIHDQVRWVCAKSGGRYEKTAYLFCRRMSGGVGKQLDGMGLW